MTDANSTAQTLGRAQVAPTQFSHYIDAAVAVARHHNLAPAGGSLQAKGAALLDDPLRDGCIMVGLGPSSDWNVNFAASKDPSCIACRFARARVVA